MDYLKRTWADISLDNLNHNYQQLRAKIPSGCRLLGVVKADAYGHGAVPISRHLCELGAEFLAVSNLEEAMQLRRGGIRRPILILGYTPPAYARDLVAMGLRQEVHSLEYARALHEELKGSERRLKVHIKLDTGMGRIGFRSADPQACVEELLPLFALPQLKIEGLYTHFAVADCPNDAENTAYTDEQERRILAVYDLLAENGHQLQHLHFMNSAATVYRPNPRCTLARVGIILYGLLPNYPVPVPLPLKPVMTLKSVISHIKEAEAGDCISYGRTYTVSHPCRIATVTIGYADGYSRLLSNKAYAIVHGVACPIVGRVCMDQLMLDISEVKDPVKPGDEVTMFGTEGNVTITPDELAAFYGTIGYEIVCGISKRVPRVVVNGDIE